jgi:hypothetical protein
MRKWLELVAVVILATSLTAASSAQLAVPSFDEVVQSLAAVNSSLNTFRVEQEIVASVLMFHFEFSASVFASRPARYHVIVHDAPWPFSSLGSKFGLAARPEEVLSQYFPRTIGWRDEDGRRWLYLSLEGRHADVNPLRVEALVDQSRWLIGKTEFHYAWGDLIAEYRYARYDGFYLPDVLLVRSPSFFLSAIIKHHDYQLNVVIPEEVFVEK